MRFEPNQKCFNISILRFPDGGLIVGFSQARAGPKVMSSSVKSCQVVSNQQKVVSSSHVKDEKYCQVMSSGANHAETPCPRVASAYTPPIDESRSGPARSAVKQAKTHLEQEAELAIMHAKKKRTRYPDVRSRHASQSCPRPSVRAWGGEALGNPWEKNANHRQRA